MTSNVSFLGKAADEYNKIWELRDPRVEGWLFMSSPLPTFLICLSYVFVVKVAGPKFMENRKPYDLRNLLIFYNFIQVIFSSWLFYETLMSGWLTEYSLRCQPVDFSYRPIAIRMTYACWWYYFSKFTEFFDTFFFVLRKKYEHVSLLHVIHHGIMPMSVWFGVRFTPGGHSTFFGLLNTFVHIVMYFYYMVAAMGPQYQKFIWWKKYLTSFQMVQFVCIFVHAFQLLFIDCDYPKVFCLWIGGHGVLFLFLFSDFYKKSYSDKRKAMKAKAENGKLASEYTNGHANGVANGYTNGYANGHANGYANGSAAHANGHAYTNGHVEKNGYANGAANGHVGKTFSFPCFLDGDSLHAKHE